MELDAAMIRDVVRRALDEDRERGHFLDENARVPEVGRVCDGGIHHREPARAKRGEQHHPNQQHVQETGGLVDQDLVDHDLRVGMAPRQLPQCHLASNGRGRI